MKLISIDNLVSALLSQLEVMSTPQPCRECATEYHLKLHLLPALAIADRIAEIAEDKGEPEAVESATAPAVERPNANISVERPNAQVSVYRYPNGEIISLAIGFKRKASAKEWGEYLVRKGDFYSYSIEPSRFPEFKYELTTVSWDASRYERLFTDYRFEELTASHEITESPSEVESVEIEAVKPDLEPVESPHDSDDETRRTPIIERPNARISVYRYPDGEIGGLGIGFDRKTSAKEWGECLKLKGDIYSYSIESSRFSEHKYELRSSSWNVDRYELMQTYQFGASTISHKPKREPEKKVRKPKLMSEQLATA